MLRYTQISTNMVLNMFPVGQLSIFDTHKRLMSTVAYFFTNRFLSSKFTPGWRMWIKKAMDSSQDQPLYSSFADVIGIVFNNWTAIKLAVEHGMGGPPAVTQHKLTDIIDSVAQTITSNNVDWYDVSDLLADAMDTEFSTILEDDSNDEVANHLCQLYQMYQTGDHPSLQAALSSLPCRTPINTVLLNSASHSVPMESSSDEEAPAEDDGWTVVKRK